MKGPAAMFLTHATNPSVDGTVQPVSVERRVRARFPVELPVRYRTVGRNPYAGLGLVVNMSSGGLLVAHQHEIGAGAAIELKIDWPSLLDGRVPLKLVIQGVVARCDTDSFAVVLSRYQFRTTRKPVIPMQTSAGEQLITREENISVTDAGISLQTVAIGPAMQRQGSGEE